MFIADIAVTLQIALIGLGYVVLHYSGKENSFYMKIGALLMIVGGILGVICTTTGMLKYHAAGAFDKPAITTTHVEHHDGDARLYDTPDQE